MTHDHPPAPVQPETINRCLASLHDEEVADLLGWLERNVVTGPGLDCQTAVAWWDSVRDALVVERDRRARQGRQHGNPGEIITTATAVLDTYELRLLMAAYRNIADETLRHLAHPGSRFITSIFAVVEAEWARRHVA